MLITRCIPDLISRGSGRVDGQRESLNQRTRQWNKRVGVRGICGASSGEVGRDENITSGHVVVVEGTVEVGQSSDGLVVRNLVASLVHASKAEVSILPYLAVLGSIHHHGLVACGPELGAVLVLHC